MAIVGMPDAQQISVLTIDRIAADLAVERSSAPAAFDQAHVRIRQLIEEQVGAAGSTEMVNRRWDLQSVVVENFRGIKRRLQYTFTADSSLTVIQGENGSGKSSLIGAIRMALEGAVGRTHAGETLKTRSALWVQSDLRARGAEQSKVVLSLRDVSDASCRLTIEATYDGARVHRTARLSIAGVIEDIGEDDPRWSMWDAAYTAASPVFAYAELANELQRVTDLQAWLIRCIGMDGAAAQLDRGLEEAIEESKKSKAAIAAAHEALLGEMEAVDAAFNDIGPEENEKEFEQPAAGMTFEDWLLTTGAVSATAGGIVLAKDPREALRAGALAYADARRRVADASTDLLQGAVLDELIELDRQIREHAQGDNHGHCPVCGTLRPSWRSDLHASVALLQVAREAGSRMRAAEAELLGGIVPTVRALFELGKDDDEPPREVVTAVRLLSSVAVGQRLEGAAVDAADLVSAWLVTQEAEDLIDQLVSRNDRRNARRARRWQVITAFRTVWNTFSSSAEELTVLETARDKIWNPYLRATRKRQTVYLRSKVKAIVDEMLQDAGIELHDLIVNKSSARIELQNALGAKIDLSHLSAGQRNALILGPVLTQGDAGIFAFSLIDDPVHAFDDYRVDRLSRCLIALASHRTVLIATHDPRFVDSVHALGGSRYAVQSMRRTGDGQVTLQPRIAPWIVLQETAKSIANDAKDTITKAGREHIGVLLRMSVDAVLEALAARHAMTLSGDERDRALKQFGKAGTTAARIAEIEKWIGDSPGRSTLWNDGMTALRPHLSYWSRCAHGNAPEHEDAPIKQAEDGGLGVRALAKVTW